MGDFTLRIYSHHHLIGTYGCLWGWWRSEGILQKIRSGAVCSRNYRPRPLSLQRISLGEKLGGIRALDGQREVARGVGAEGVGRVEEDEFAARAHVPGEGIESFFRPVESFELLFDVVGEEILLAPRVLGAEGSGERSEQSFAACDDGGEGDFFSCLCVEGRAAFTVHRVHAAGVGDAETAEADHLFVDASPLRDDRVVEVGDVFEEAVLAVAVLAFIGEIEALFCSLRLVLVPGVEGARERFAPFAFDVKYGMAGVGHAFAVGIQGLDAMVFDEEPRNGGFDGAFLVVVGGSFCRTRVLFDCILLRCRMDDGCEGQVVRNRRNGSEQEDGCEGECVDFSHGMNLLFDGSAYTLLFPVCNRARSCSKTSFRLLSIG